MPTGSETAPESTSTGWRSGLGDLARGLEFGMWASALFTAPIACMLLGGSLATLPYTGLTWTAVVGLAWFTALWIGRCVGMGLPIAAPVGVIAWLYRGIARRLGRPGPEGGWRRPRRRRRWAVVAGLGAIGVVAGIAGGSYLLRYSFRSAEEAVAETDAIDPDWRIDDLMANREGVPDDENSALIAAQVVARIPKDWPPAPPSGSEPEPGALDVRTALELADKVDDSRRLDEPIVEAIRAELETRREAVAIAREMADYDRGRHELQLGSTLIDTPLPETQEARAVARLLNADAFLSAQFGESDQALESCRAIFGTARSIGDEPTLISQLVRTAIDAVAARTVRRVLGQGEPSDDEALAALQDLVQDERDRPRLLWALRGDRGMFAELIRRITEGELPISALSEGLAANGALKGGPVSGLLAVGGRYQFSVMLRWFNELIAILDRPESEWASGAAAWERKVLAVKNSRLGFLTTTLPLLLMPAVQAAFSAELRIRAELGALTVLLAAERHRQATGAWPSSIAGIDPEILPDPPLDPYTGEPYRLEHADGRLRVYSLGPNRRDEHGSYDAKKWGKIPTDDDVGTFAYDPDLRGRPAEAKSGGASEEEAR